ncbi:MFS general substrate transporter [Aaosphaeria arxii CBS 175.79]|uniref:MFS general substrate transporter n=1 Tax=Aaosphaeria arxii CBS 175.79 TaxID=1450172 RepID=A0A6A5XMN0_9PLEO|nr:MFS general substrate transporter [Aaosphaeria arxii CBS 175.79]KAF2014000.1 MFS general substrate transporter [Aaosphaeria arxii CBS 175.79]
MLVKGIRNILRWDAPLLKYRQLRQDSTGPDQGTTSVSRDTSSDPSIGTAEMAIPGGRSIRASSPTSSSSMAAAALAEEAHQLPKLSLGLLIALTCSIGGLQFVWSTIFSHGSAYLFSLGITESQSSLIWAIAPICGAFVQPVVGALADNSRSRWGRRRPFILGGAIGVVISIILLAWIDDIMRCLTAILGIQSKDTIQTTVQVGTIVCIALLNLAVQPLQLGLRALIVDVCPSEQQSLASAWAGRFTGISNILGYLLGSLSIGPLAEDDESWRFRFLSLLTVFMLSSTVVITLFFIREHHAGDLVAEVQEPTSIFHVFRDVKDGWAIMSPQARRVCLVQFCSWMGWFGFLFYSTSYVGRLYLAESRKQGVEPTDALKDASIRIGTFASVLSSITAFATTVIAPHIAASKSTLPSPILDGLKARVSAGWWRQKHILWAMSLFLYAFCTFCTFFISSTNAAIFIVTLVGLSWGITQWAPFALLGEEIAMHEVEGEDDDSEVEKGREGMTAQSGAIMGVHNAAISIPQILAAFGSSFIFWLCKGDKPGEGNGIPWVLRISGVAALVAAYFAWRLK